ncbi:MAG: hypothetical protein SPL98_00925 [Bacteroidales bacterium]|nr:hypothetical protein [Bacteroidales bacterium]
MDRAKLNDILATKESMVTMQDLVMLGRLTMKYPYCSLFWVLGAKFADLIDSFNKEEWLRKAATYTSDREYLKEHLAIAREHLQREKQQQMAKSEKSYDIITEIDSYKEENFSSNPTKEELINRFLKIENPKIAKDESSEENENIDKAIRKSAKDDFKVVTETMAKIYLKQGNKEKAMQIYQQLMTSNPKKSIYFANQIEKIKNS